MMEDELKNYKWMKKSQLFYPLIMKKNQ
jgi:hypothetical protein